MEIVFEMKVNQIDFILDRIRNDIHELMTNENIRPKDIKVSMPKFFYNFVEHTTRYRSTGYQYHVRSELFGVEIVFGYNNQVCVFNENAGPKDLFMKPIEIKI